LVVIANRQTLGIGKRFLQFGGQFIEAHRSLQKKQSGMKIRMINPFSRKDVTKAKMTRIYILGSTRWETDTRLPKNSLE
jgi:hypothetical protein